MLLTPSLLGLGAKLLKPNTAIKMQVRSYDSRILTTQEQKLPRYKRELCAISIAFSEYEFIIISSKFLITVVTDHSPIHFLFTRKGTFTPTQIKLKRYYQNSQTFD